MSLRLNGTSQAVNTGGGRNLLVSVNGGTMMLWFNVVPGISSSQQDMFDLNATNTATFRCRIVVNASSGIVMTQYRTLNSDPTDTFQANTAFGTGWNHVAVVLLFSQGIGFMYINGVLDSTHPFNNQTLGATSNTTPAFSSIGNNPVGLNWTNGSVADARVYGRGLGPDEIKTIYTAKGADNNFSSQQARWFCKDLGPNKVATAVADYSPNSYGGIPVGSPTFSTDPLVYGPKLRRSTGALGRFAATGFGGFGDPTP